MADDKNRRRERICLRSSSSQQIDKNNLFLIAHLGALGLPGSLEDGGGAAVGEDGVQDSVVDVVVEGRVDRRQLHADHQSVLSGVRLGQGKKASRNSVKIKRDRVNIKGEHQQVQIYALAGCFHISSLKSSSW